MPDSSRSDSVPLGAADVYFSGVRRRAESFGLERVVGTAVVADPERVGSGTATSYPLPGLTVVFADEAVTDRLAGLESSESITTDEFVAATRAVGGELAGIGHQRVLDGVAALRDPRAQAAGTVARRLDGHDSDDRRLLADLIEVCGPDDADEADILLDEPDPVIIVRTGRDGAIAAYASARPWEQDERFDDIGVLTHPAYRGRRLGALAVHDFIVFQRHNAPERLQLYRCSSDNPASNRTAERLGFTLIQRIGAVRFDGLASD